MNTNVTAEAVFNKHAIALALPKLDEDESFDEYVKATALKNAELKRRLQLAWDAAQLADHTDCAHWCAQARHLLPKD